MRLSTVVELFLILLLVAFAAYGRVIDRDEVNNQTVRAENGSRQMGLPTMSLKQAADSVNRYCTCSENICNCCRDFHIPLVQLKGPGCASLQYLQGDNLAVQLSFGDNILTSTIVNGKSPKPVCVPLPGGFTKFCGRIYSIQRDAKNHFKACLGLELQSSTELEASLRVSCFRFGPDGLKLRPAEPLPVVETEASDEEDDDDFFGLGGGDDDDDDEDETPAANSVPGATADEAEDDDDDDDDDDDILGLSSLLDIITGDDDTPSNRPEVTSQAPLLEFTIPILNKPSTAAPIEPYDPLTAANIVPDSSNAEASEELSQEADITEEEPNEESTDLQAEEVEPSAPEEIEDLVPETSNKVTNVVKPTKSTNKVKATTVQKKKPSSVSPTANDIEEEIKKKKKPLKKPHKDEDEDDDLLGEEDLDEDDEDDEILSDEDEKDDEDDEDEAEDEDDDEKVSDDKHEDHYEDEDDKAEDVEDLDDDDDEEEDAMISALVYDEKEEGKKSKPLKNESSEEDDDSDYGLGLSGFLARKRQARLGPLNKVTKV